LVTKGFQNFEGLFSIMNQQKLIISKAIGN
jgi:hypothetical protein